MALTLGDNFSYGGSKPLDARLTYATLADMKAVADSTMYNGCLAYCVATDKNYQWKSSNTVDPDTGKWREFTTGSSIDVDDEIDEESANPVQNAVIAEALDAKQDAADKMTAFDMDDVVTPLPSVGSKYPVLFDETGEERVVGWYRLANGTKKPVYEQSTKVTSNFASNITISCNADKLINMSAIIETNDSPPYYVYAYSNVVGTSLHMNVYGGVSQTNSIYARVDSYTGNNIGAVYYKWQYTKTTDTPS